MPGQTASRTPYRPFPVQVARTLRLSPSFRRLTFTGAELGQFTSGGGDQRVKLLVPIPGRATPDWLQAPDWYTAWRQLPETRRHPMRTYTVRAWRPDSCEVDVDVVLHGATGPASAWAEFAAPGEEVVLIGPDARFDGSRGGVEWNPPASASGLLLAGDETAVPAICAITEMLKPGTRARALLEVPTGGDVLDLDASPGLEVTWLPRQAAGATAPRGRLLAEAVTDAVRALTGPTTSAATSACMSMPLFRLMSADPADDVDASALWDVPPADSSPSAGLYGWLAGEAAVVRGLRRHLVQEAGLDRASVAFMGYWRRGQGQLS